MGIGTAVIERYVWRTIVPYFFLAWFLLTAILLLQQASRYSDILFGAQIPSSLVWELLVALLPNILAFTSPMALFTGVMIGLGQMQGDSELIALRAAGVSNFKILSPAFLLGFLLTILTLYINFEGVPKSARLVRQVGVKAALAKLESPLEPGVFNNEIPKYVIYTREGNREKGVWERVFIHAREKSGEVRLITARSGKIDSAGEQSELVLQDAVVTTLNRGKQIALERVNSLRVALEMGRRQLVDKLQKVERAPEEMGLNELAAFSEQKSGKEKRDAEVFWHRRVSLAVAPLVFAFLGVALSLRYARGGRGFNGILALLTMVCYYLVSLLFEQMSRAGSISVFWGSWTAPALAFLFSLWLLSKGFRKSRLTVFGFAASDLFFLGRFFSRQNVDLKNRRKTNFRVDLSGLLNRDLVIDLLKYFTFATGGLLFLYLIFTSFELWRFAAATPSGYEILGKYLLYISPIVVFQFAPSSLLLAVLFAYGIRSRRSEIIAWSGAGQNVFRLLIPAFFLSGLVGLGAWVLQENVLPQTNKRQDALRAQLKGGAAIVSREGRFWFAEQQKMYSFVTEKDAQATQAAQLKEVEVYDFGDEGFHLRRMFRSEQGILSSGNLWLDKAQQVSWKNNLVEVENKAEPQSLSVEADLGDLGLSGSKFFYASLSDLKDRLKTTESVSEGRRLKVVQQKHFAITVLPPIIVLFSAPFAVTFGRRANNGKANLSLVYVFGIWLGFMALSAFFEQLGNSGLLTDYIAVWAPLLILASIGAYFLAKTPN